MIPGIYSAATAMQQASQRHELISQNLSHINMPGYRRVSLPQQTFESTFSEAQQQKFAYNSLGTASKGPAVDFSPGFTEHTDQPLDFAIQGDGFFTVEASDQELYTRNGAFHVNSEGRLVTGDGYPVKADSGNLTLPPNSSINDLQVTADGTATVNGVGIGKLKIVRFDDPQTLQSKGVTLFAAPAGVTPQNTDAIVQQGSREHSNVHPVRELVDLIAASRAHESAQKAMNSLSAAIENHTNLRG